MTDSPRLEEVFAAVLAEHAYRSPDFRPAQCSAGDWEGSPREFVAHQAERLAARFEQVGEHCPEHHGLVALGKWDWDYNDAHREDGTNDVCDDPVPVFRLVGGDQ